MPPRVSVIIPTFNTGRFIEGAVQSVFAQTETDFELIVVDDGSTDDTRGRLRPYEGKIRYVYQTNSGRPSARNKGLELAQGEFLAFLDADDIWMPDRLERGLRFLEAKKDAGLVHGEVEMIDSRGRLLDDETRHVKTIYQMEAKKGSGYLRLLDRCAIFSSTVLLRRACAEKVGAYDARFPIYEDYDWYLRFSMRFSVGLLGAPAVAHYRVHQGNVSTQYDRLRTAEIYIAILRKNLEEAPARLSAESYRRARSRILIKLAEFYEAARQKKEARSSILEAVRHEPALLFDRHTIKRLLFSLG